MLPQTFQYYATAGVRVIALDGALGKAGKGKRGESITGPRGEKGEKGEPGPSIHSWQLDPERYRVSPLWSDGEVGPILELRRLFEHFMYDIGGLDEGH